MDYFIYLKKYQIIYINYRYKSNMQQIKENYK